jgi:DNA polymerase-4
LPLGLRLPNCVGLGVLIALAGASLCCGGTAERSRGRARFGLALAGDRRGYRDRQPSGGTKGSVRHEVWAWCDKAKAFARTVTVKVKFADFHRVTRSRSFSTAIRRASVELVRTLLPTNKGVRLLGVTVSNFDRASADANDELPLFGADEATLPPRLSAWPR